uniref:Uncharacterized protein n=1 Tax=Megaselia scalaris TaxID=36166 RepID=T1GN81_MEGSC
MLDLKSKFMPILEKVQQTNDTLETTSRIMNKAYNILEEFLNNVPRSSLIKDVFKKIEDTLNASQYSIDFGEIQENPLT